MTRRYLTTKLLILEGLENYDGGTPGVISEGMAEELVNGVGYRLADSEEYSDIFFHPGEFKIETEEF